MASTLVVGSQVINKILQTKDYNFIKTNGLDETYFVGFEKEFNFIDEHYKKHGNIPDVMTFLEHFQDFGLYEVNETDDYLLDRLYEEKAYTNIRPFLNEANNKLKEDARLAYNFMVDNIDKVKPHTVVKSKDIIDDANERYEEYMNRNNSEVAMTISSGMPELDEVFGGWEFGEELVTLVARTNQGKCHSFGTLILMADGTTKKVEDIKIGDKVQSLGRVNTVLGTHKGRSKGYRIVPLKAGEPFDITDDHILTVWHRNAFWDADKKRMVTDGTGTLMDIKIEEFLAKSKRFQHDCFLYRPSIEYPEKDLKIPPYILGLWLGDGTSCRPELTNKDDEVIQEWKKYALSENLQVSIHQKKNNKVISMDITKGNKNNEINIVLEKFREYGILNNKHIPLDYLTSSREQRLELLAGIIDTDGSYGGKYGNNIYEITTKLDSLSQGYCQLLRGLGFKVNHHIKHDKKFNKDYHRISFSGDLQDIPCRLRKATMQSSIRREPCISRFRIERIEEEFDYAGFQCDGDHRFLLADNTITHNSWILMKFLAEAWKQGYRVGLYSGEMSPNKLGYRFDALFGHFSNRSLVRGHQVEGYKDYIERLTNNNGACFKIATQKDFGGRPTVQHIRNFVEENKLQIVGIDQLSLMSDGRASRNDPPRMRLSHIAEDLFLLSTDYKIPILALAQANRAGINKDDMTDAPGLENIKESDDIAHNSSKCIGMRQNNGTLILDIIKNREGRVGDKLCYTWDIDVGHFSYFSTNGDAAPAPIKEVVNQQVKQSVQAVTSKNPF